MKTGRLWARLVGGSALVGMVLGAGLIVGRDSGGSRNSESPPSQESPVDPTGVPFPGPFTAGDVEELENCVETDSDREPKPPRAGLARMFRVAKAPFDRGLAHDEVVDVASQVERLRGLRFRRPVSLRFVPRGSLQRLFLSLTDAEDNPERRRSFLFATEDLLHALGAVPPESPVGVDQFYNPVIGDVVGFYENFEIAVMVGRGESSFDASERSTIAHELEHALSDQVLGLPTLSGLDPTRDGDGHTAAAAVVEGAAQLLGGRFDISQPGFPAASPFGVPVQTGPDEFSYYLSRSRIFPYTEGLKFVCTLHRRGGWRAVNAAFDDPPETTLEVLYPEIYFSPYEPPSVRPARQPGPRWDLELSTTFGALDWMLLFQAPGNNPGFGIEDARSLVRGWSAGHVSLWRKGDFVAIAIVGEMASFSRMCAAVEDWYDSAFEFDESSPGDGDIVREWNEPSVQDTALTCPGSEIRLGIGPNRTVARRLVR